MATKDLLTRDPEKWFALEALVESGVSYNEITRTLGICHKTVKRYYPGYKPFERGGGNEIREANRKLREFETSGKIQSNRDVGFNMRKDVL